MDQQLQNLLQLVNHFLKQVVFLVFHSLIDIKKSYLFPFPKYNYGSWANL
jgi:hypothetical protein